MHRVENIVAKGGIAHYEQFLLLPQCFQKSSDAESLESVYMWEMVKTGPIGNYSDQLSSKQSLNPDTTVRSRPNITKKYKFVKT